jgi:hypothetical protein
MSMQEELDMDAVRRQQLVDATIHNKMDTVIGLVESDHALIDHRVNRRSTLLVSRELTQCTRIGLESRASRQWSRRDW